PNKISVGAGPTGWVLFEKGGLSASKPLAAPRSRGCLSDGNCISVGKRSKAVGDPNSSMITSRARHKNLVTCNLTVSVAGLYCPRGERISLMADQAKLSLRRGTVLPYPVCLSGR